MLWIEGNQAYLAYLRSIIVLKQQSRRLVSQGQGSEERLDQMRGGLEKEGLDRMCFTFDA